MRKRIAYLIAAMLLVTGLAGLLVLVLIQSDETDSEELQLPPNADVQPERERSTLTNLVDQETIAETASNSSDDPDFLTVCTDPTVEILGEDCLRTLDQFFASKTFGEQVKILGPDALILLDYGRIFADPDGDRWRVLATLDNEECFDEGKVNQEYWRRSGRNRYESCNADAFTNYAQFGAICHGFRDGRDAEREWIDRNWVASTGKTRFQHFLGVLDGFRENSDDEVAYERRKEWLWEEVLEVRWLKQQCARFDTVPTLHDDLVSNEYQQIQNLLVRLNHSIGTDWDSQHPRTNIYEGLTVLAWFLGEGVTTEGYRQGSEAWQELVYGVHVERDPKFRDWDDFSKLDRGLLGPTTARGTRMFTAVRAAMALEKLDIDYDWHWLVESVCRTSDYRGPGEEEEGNKSCRWWVSEFRTGLADGPADPRYSQDPEVIAAGNDYTEKFLRALERIEEVAMELGIYD